MGACSGDKPSLFSFLGVAHMVCGFLAVALQSAALIISEDPYMYETVLRYHHVFRSAPGIWAGAASFATGILAMIAAGRLRQSFRYPYTLEQFLSVAEGLGALSIVSALFNAAMVIIHGYIMVLLHRVLLGRYGYYEHTSKIHVIILFVLSGLMVVAGLLEMASQVIGAVAACRALEAGRKELSYEEVPIRERD
ncbi:hypothetical protein BV898_11455 [Hypsibius exemplaris]|uniref:Uncharacterized protein n=1 Tax=Hypsibius exemplaris TaxID=2072580 RepID=A0A1W0WGM3_HYPEX|nr:hypothetical protein BV898_11455 [Hypsibius exemplaris]